VKSDDIKSRLDAYFGFYQRLAKRLQNLSRTYCDEAGLLALCYIDALSESARRHAIDNMISKFSQWKELPGLVSLGRLYYSIKWLSTLPEPTEENTFLSKHLEDEFWGRDAYDIKKVIKELTAVYPQSHWTLFLTALEEFVRRRLREARKERKLFLRARNIDLPPGKLAGEFRSYISTGADPFLSGYGVSSNQERFGVLSGTLDTPQTNKLFEFFTFSRVFKRDYRNPMVHKTVAPSQGRDWAEKVNEPYYLFKPAGVNELVVQTVVPFRFFVETFVECLNNYEEFCRDGTRDPIPRLPQV
jgi:hypothetical protein